jgi:arylsulfatase A-like enzyme
MKKPHILLITIDSLRADHVSTYGHYRETTPFIDLFAKESTIFRNAYSAANWTGASLASILTGLYPTVHGYTNKRYYIDPDVKSVPSILKDNGYSTICFSNNMYLSSRTGLSRGFEQYLYQGQIETNGNNGPEEHQKNSIFNNLKQSLPLRYRSLAKDLYDGFDTQKKLTRDDGAFATERAFFKWLSNYNFEKPFFAHIHYQEPHSIYFPPQPYRKRFFRGSWLEESKYLEFDHMGYFAGQLDFTEEQVEHYKELYDGEIAYTDWRLGRLFKFIQSQKIMDDTVVIITSDHGENMGENGYFWHAFCLLDSLIKVPLLIRYPDWFTMDKWNENIVQTVDIVPTLLDGIGVDWQYAQDQQGVSMLNGTPRTAAMTETYTPEMMIDRWLNRRTDLQKKDFQQYIRDLRTFQTEDEKLVWSSDGWHSFFDMKKDPQEFENIYDSSNQQVVNAEKSLKNWFGSFKPHVADDTQPGFDKRTWEKMRELGYA